ncbi:hypothetical protein [Clostridium amazonitimonense]|uniref:hypothetical protein n=1 Tax=Clostridium amazonitimonense TaxID=1499689 RepID=UPI00050965A8|nr:hypothetical protein [Clostridium amazonitimonense]
MKKFKKLLFSVLVCALVASTSTITFASTLPNAPKDNHTCMSEVNRLCTGHKYVYKYSYVANDVNLGKVTIYVYQCTNCGYFLETPTRL